MKICFAVLHYDAAHREPRAYLARVPIHREIPRELAALGHRVEVVHLFPTDAEFEEDGVRYRFIASPKALRLLGKTVGLVRRRDQALYEPAFRAIQAVCESNADIVHFHGVTLNLNLYLLLRALNGSCETGRTHRSAPTRMGTGGTRRSAPTGMGAEASSPPDVVLHYHGGYPAVNPLARAVQRHNLGRASRLLFTTRDQADPFVKAAMLDELDRVVELTETSSAFTHGSRSEARRTTGMEGDPVFLWAGRLHPIKDPITALRGFDRIAAVWPDARLYMHYLSDELLPAVEAFIAASPALVHRVHLRGPASFERMEAIYNSADFLLQASVREFSGCAILEAMSCGVIPVVTNIPSFRTMTDEGRFGVLFSPGDPGQLAKGVLAIPRMEIPLMSAAVRDRFERALSFSALAKRLEEIYEVALSVGC